MSSRKFTNTPNNVKLNTSYVSQQTRRKFEECIQGDKCLKLHLTLSHMIPNACGLCALELHEDTWAVFWQEMESVNASTILYPTPSQVFNLGRDIEFTLGRVK